MTSIRTQTTLKLHRNRTRIHGPCILTCFPEIQHKYQSYNHSTYYHNDHTTASSRSNSFKAFINTDSDCFTNHSGHGHSGHLSISDVSNRRRHTDLPEGLKRLYTLETSFKGMNSKGTYSEFKPITSDWVKSDRIPPIADRSNRSASERTRSIKTIKPKK